MFEFITQIFQQQQIAQEPINAVEQIKVGCHYLTPREEGGYTVNKVLYKDEQGVHLRTYSNIFYDIPTQLDTNKLFIAGMDDISDEVAMGMGHIPVSFASFMTWQAIDLNTCQTVDESELKGYRIWQEAEGGYF